MTDPGRSPEQLDQRESESGHDVFTVQALSRRDDSGRTIGVAHGHQPLPRLDQPDQAGAAGEVVRALLLDVRPPAARRQDLDGEIGRTGDELLWNTAGRQPGEADVRDVGPAYG